MEEQEDDKEMMNEEELKGDKEEIHFLRTEMEKLGLADLETPSKPVVEIDNETKLKETIDDDVHSCKSTDSRASINPQALIRQARKARLQRKEAESKGEIPVPFEDFLSEAFDESASMCSFSTTASSIPPEKVKFRTQKDLERLQNKQISKKSLRVKGEANAFNRMKKANRETIQESIGWDFY